MNNHQRYLYQEKRIVHVINQQFCKFNPHTERILVRIVKNPRGSVTELSRHGFAITTIFIGAVSFTQNYNLQLILLQDFRGSAIDGIVSAAFLCDHVCSQLYVSSCCLLYIFSISPAFYSIKYSSKSVIYGMGISFCASFSFFTSQMCSVG